MKKKYSIKTDKIYGKVVKAYALQENSWWNVYTFLTPIILDALKQFRDARRSGSGKKAIRGTPMNYLSKKALDSKGGVSDDEYNTGILKFERDIDRAIEAFELLQSEDDGNYNFKNYKEDYKRIKRGLKVFAKVYQSLWD